MAEPKTHQDFPDSQFIIDSYFQTFRCDRNQQHNGILVFFREDIPFIN